MHLQASIKILHDHNIHTLPQVRVNDTQPLVLTTVVGLRPTSGKCYVYFPCRGATAVLWTIPPSCAPLLT